MMEIGSDRYRVKECIKNKFKDGLEPGLNGYCYYILKNDHGEYCIEHLTSGIYNGVPLPPLYLTWEEAFDLVKNCFNPKR